MIRKVFQECGTDSIGSLLLERLSPEMKSRQTYDKVFEKIWGGSGEKKMLVLSCLSYPSITAV